MVWVCFILTFAAAALISYGLWRLPPLTREERIYGIGLLSVLVLDSAWFLYSAMSGGA